MSSKPDRLPHAARAWRSAFVIALGLTLVAMKGEPFRYSREIVTRPGWAVLELPDDVLAAARPGLSDLRIQSAKGELGYVFEERLWSDAPRIELHNVETRPGRETTALLERGPHAPLCQELELEIAGEKPYLKPIVVEASPDGASFAEVTRTSIFRHGSGVEMSRVIFPPNERRLFRIRLDDVNSEPVRPLAARCHEALSPVAPLRTIAVGLERVESGDESADRFVLRFPSANLPVIELNLAIEGLAFAREARVYERILFRDELSRRVVGSGKLERSASGKELTKLDLSELSGSVLELEIDRAGAPLEVTGVRAVVRPKRLVFVAPEEAGLTLLYGSSTAPVPRYDLADALKKGRPRAPAPATLGPAKDSGKATALSAPARGPAVDPALWARRSPIVLPAKGPVAYLDLGGAAARELDQVRIVDSSRRQVPFLVEAGERLVKRPLSRDVRREGKSTFVRLHGIDPTETVANIELHASAPEYFERRVTLSVEVKDRRGVVGRKELGTAQWVRRPDAKQSFVSIPVSSSGESEIEVEIDDGDNPPLTLSAASAELVRKRVDFLFEPGEKLELLSGNPAVAAPRYDINLIAEAVLSSPALASELARTAVAKMDEPKKTPPWFWWVVVGSGLVVVLALVRVRKTSEGTEKGAEGTPGPEGRQ